MRTPFIAGNWKMHKTIGEAVALANELVQAFGSVQDTTIMIAPPFTALSAVAPIISGTTIALGAQNMASELSGAHTGEVSALMLRDIGVSHVILGHSERRHVYGESNELINKKVKLALEQGLTAILCVGETEQEREQGITNKVVGEQCEKGLAGVSSEQMKKIVIAYEPVWAIGTGKTATPEDADATHEVIRKLAASLYSREVADKLVIQYGGSVKPDNVKELMAKENIDGALVGGASLTAAQFVPIVNF
ncbi:MAG: triose-phosphate isomerase [Spirochaetales bacterium]|nr:triose-phosphate isomerase [Spirochaetales bacterium]